MSGISWMFVDLNSYFASVEQELCPELRGLPVGIVPLVAETTCCIAVSYQARAYGIRTGTGVAEAKSLCPSLVLVNARPHIYVEYHNKIVTAIERCIPIQEVLSCDEFSCELVGSERSLDRATKIAYAIKKEIRLVGESLRCSIGVGPNRLLTKIAGDMQKPDGYMVFRQEDLPHVLYSLELEDIPGIGRRMEKRMRANGIATVRELCALSRGQMHAIIGSVWADRLWLWLRGENFIEPEKKKLQTLSRQHVLPPDCRTRERIRGVVLKLLHSTARKLRGKSLWAGGVFVHINFYGTEMAYEANARFEPTEDMLTLQAHMIELLDRMPHRTDAGTIYVAITNLCPEPNPGLFNTPQETKLTRLGSAVDKINARHGFNSVYLGSIHDVRKQAPTRISFGPPPSKSEFNDTADTMRKPASRTGASHLRGARAGRASR